MIKLTSNHLYLTLDDAIDYLGEIMSTETPFVNINNDSTFLHDMIKQYVATAFKSYKGTPNMTEYTTSSQSIKVYMDHFEVVVSIGLEIRAYLTEILEGDSKSKTFTMDASVLRTRLKEVRGKRIPYKVEYYINGCHAHRMDYYGVGRDAVTLRSHDHSKNLKNKLTPHKSAMLPSYRPYEHATITFKVIRLGFDNNGWSFNRYVKNAHKHAMRGLDYAGVNCNGVLYAYLCDQYLAYIGYKVGIPYVFIHGRSIHNLERNIVDNKRIGSQGFLRIGRKAKAEDCYVKLSEVCKSTYPSMVKFTSLDVKTSQVIREFKDCDNYELGDRFVDKNNNKTYVLMRIGVHGRQLVCTDFSHTITNCEILDVELTKIN